MIIHKNPSTIVGLLGMESDPIWVAGPTRISHHQKKQNVSKSYYSPILRQKTLFA